MNAQMALKGLAITCLAISWYCTLHLLGTYFDAVTGQLNGAGAAQWQFAFFTAPLPSLLGILALVITRFSRRLLPPRWTGLSIISALAPALLFSLVFFHVY